MDFEQYDRVRLTSEEDGIPAGSEGTIIGAPAHPYRQWVRFFKHGAREVPERSLEAVKNKDE